eukprot:m.92769 g.92769  ORF g.92769 m.92769 type:complete len:223 (+) comp13363_c0_seq7:372-1040(+)
MIQSRIFKGKRGPKGLNSTSDCKDFKNNNSKRVEVAPAPPPRPSQVANSSPSPTPRLSSGLGMVKESNENDIYADFGLPENNNELTIPDLVSCASPGPKVGIAMPRGSEENGTIKSPEPSDAASSSSSNSLLCDFTRVQAESFIKENGSKDGDYLFRVSRGAVVLSVCDGKNIHHLVVEDKGAAMEAKRFDERRFKRFVKHYTKTVTGLPTQLQRNIASLRS